MLEEVSEPRLTFAHILPFGCSLLALGMAVCRWSEAVCETLGERRQGHIQCATMPTYRLSYPLWDICLAMDI